MKKTNRKEYLKEYRNSNRGILIEKNRARRAKYLNNGLYHRDGRPLVEGRTRCAICLLKNKSRQAERHLNNPELFIFRGIKRRAQEYNVEFNITLSDITIPKLCPILGIPIFPNSKHVKYNSPTLDRKDPQKGYIKGNIWVVSSMANRMKTDANPEQLLKFADWVYQNYKEVQ